MPKIKIKRKAILKPEYGIAILSVGADAKHGTTIVDIEDAWLDKYFWTKDTGGYVSCAPVRGEGRIYLHRLICPATKANPIIDHINRDIRDNRSRNLRRATPSKNRQNIAAYKTMNGKKTSSPYKGVAWTKNYVTRPWRCSFNIDGKPYHEYFENEIDAALRYNELAKKHHRKFAVLNIIDE